MLLPLSLVTAIEVRMELSNQHRNGDIDEWSIGRRCENRTGARWLDMQTSVVHRCYVLRV